MTIQGKILQGLVVCADDYALSPGVSKAIIFLIERGRITATSCMTLSPFWPEHADWLGSINLNADVGLHLTLTDHSPLGPMPTLAPRRRLPSFKRILGMSLGGKLDEKEIKDEINRQFIAFEEALGRPPDFIDSHHHVHQLPWIRRWVIELIAGYSKNNIWMRVGAESVNKILLRKVDVWKTLSIGCFGYGLKKMLQEKGISHNCGFTGIYNFKNCKSYELLLDRFLEEAVHKTLLMCHPAIIDDELRSLDDLIEPREEEFKVFAGEKYLPLLFHHALRLERFSEILPSSV